MSELVGRIEFPRPDCPSCSTAMGLWSGYQRHVRHGGRCERVFVPRVRCAGCAVTHAMLPAFLLVGRLDTVESVGAVIEDVGAGRGGVRPAAERLGVPYTTARDWWRRFKATARAWRSRSRRWRWSWGGSGGTGPQIAGLGVGGDQRSVARRRCRFRAGRRWGVGGSCRR